MISLPFGANDLSYTKSIVLDNDGRFNALDMVGIYPMSLQSTCEGVIQSSHRLYSYG